MAKYLKSWWAYTYGRHLDALNAEIRESAKSVECDSLNVVY